ncbi:MAG TPA: hypothetical protein GX745_07670, partial [Clostridiales bacterium]|nr:hypothetical protein [Clostridiales bacterium]
MAIPTQRQIHAKLEVIRPNGTPVDVTDYLESIEIELGSIEKLGTGTGADIGVRSLTAKLRNTPGKRFAPRDKTSDWNIVNGQWEPLLWPYRGIRFQVFPQRGVGPGQSLTDIVESQADFAKGVFTSTKTLGRMVVLEEGATSGNWRKNINLSQVKYVQSSKIEWEAITDILYYDDQVSRDSEDVIGDSEDAIGDSEDSAAVFFNALFNTQAQT